MITIDLNEYRLTYFRKSDGRKFLVRRTGGSDYMVYDTEAKTKQAISYHFLRKNFVPCEDNFKNIKEKVQLRVC